jgi:type VI secretion system secreted protein VgrG
MPSPLSGQAGTPITPLTPQTATPADNAVPGQVSDAQANPQQPQPGKYDAVLLKPHKPPSSKQDKKQKPHWIEIQLFDSENNPVPGEPYQITLPDNTIAEGSLDEKGLARVDGIEEAGNCQITFPNRDKDAWQPK